VKTGIGRKGWEKRANELAAFLLEACAGDAALRQEVESLLAQKAGYGGEDWHWDAAWETSRIGPSGEAARLTIRVCQKSEI
jgi:hypothetical protein